MNQYLTSYQVIMRTVGPVFIGSGKEIGKKEYIFLKRDQVGIPDIQGLYGALQKRKKEEAFEEYLLGKGRMDLTGWLQKQRIKMEEILPFIKYTLDCGDAIIEKGSNRLQIMECVKDPYGKPYIPGSSLKGMFRTIFLGADIIAHPEKYRNAKKDLWQKGAIATGRNYYLKNNIADIESTAYRTLQRNEKKPNDAVNDLLQGFVVSDSEPLSADDLVLCQKIERHTDGTEKRLPLLRECIRPETEIRFTITVDKSVCPLTGKSIVAAVKVFIQSYYRDFAKAFSGMDIPKTNYVLCGGGCGFVSKTIVYPMFGKEKGIQFTQQVFDKTKVPRTHGHEKDQMYNASPHIIKCTAYRGKTLQMGMCRIQKIVRR